MLIKLTIQPSNKLTLIQKKIQSANKALYFEPYLLTKGMLHNISPGAMTYHNALSEELVAVFYMSQANIYFRVRI
jgi:hypothetical protein